DYTTNQLRVKNKEKLNDLISQAFAQMQIEELHAMLQKAQIAFSSVNTVKELSSHPHLKRTPVQMQDDIIQIVAPPATFRGEERTLGPVPGLGAHTDLIREEFG
ncbi:MAG TPA: CoA transferase, partial [Paenalcaligenes sp.]|nr:CoA transferase [Paenalcaligenes sp.]